MLRWLCWRVLIHRGGSAHVPCRSCVDNRFRPQASAPTGETQRLMTDRSAYISYLECQMQRVSAACLQSSAASARVDDFQAELARLDAKVRATVACSKPRGIAAHYSSGMLTLRCYGAGCQDEPLGASRQGIHRLSGACAVMLAD